jgi:hypothetical protein
LFPAHQLIPGDIVLLEAGVEVPADVRVLRASTNALVDPSDVVDQAPTRRVESQSSARDPFEAPNLLLFGTVLMQGHVLGMIVGTGNQTVIRKLSSVGQLQKNESLASLQTLGNLSYGQTQEALHQIYDQGLIIKSASTLLPLHHPSLLLFSIATILPQDRLAPMLESIATLCSELKIHALVLASVDIALPTGFAQFQFKPEQIPIWSEDEKPLVLVSVPNLPSSSIAIRSMVENLRRAGMHSILGIMAGTIEEIDLEHVCDRVILWHRLGPSVDASRRFADALTWSELPERGSDDSLTWLRSAIAIAQQLVEISRHPPNVSPSTNLCACSGALSSCTLL